MRGIFFHELSVGIDLYCTHNLLIRVTFAPTPAQTLLTNGVRTLFYKYVKNIFCAPCVVWFGVFGVNTVILLFPFRCRAFRLVCMVGTF